MRYVYLALIALLTTAVIVFMAQNIGSVTVSFLTVRLTLPLSLLVPLVYVLGMVSGGALLSLLRAWIRGARGPAG